MRAATTRVLIDTSLWVEFLRGADPAMQELLREDRVATHSCVIGELMVGSLSRRAMVLDLLLRLPRVEEAEFMEGLTLIERQRLWGVGLQWNDVLILAACRISGVKLWTLDTRLAQAAAGLGVAWGA